MRSRGGGRLLVGSLGLPHIKSKALNSWEAIRGTYFFTKDVFEKHKVVFTVGTSVASVATAWGGYTLHHHHQTKIARRLESIEKAIKTNTELEHSELRKLVDPGSSRASTLFATAATTFILGKKDDCKVVTRPLDGVRGGSAFCRFPTKILEDGMASAGEVEDGMQIENSDRSR